LRPGRRQVGLLECGEEQDPKVFRYVGVWGVRTGERHIRRDGRRKEQRLVEAGGVAAHPTARARPRRMDASTAQAWPGREEEEEMKAHPLCPTRF